MKTFSNLLLGAAVLVSAAACESSGGPGEELAQVRLIHARTGTAAVDLVVDGSTVADAITFARASTLSSVDAGSATLEIRPAGSSGALASAHATLETGRRYTALFSESQTGAELRISADTAEGLPEATPPPQPGDTGAIPGESKIKLRVIHNAREAQPLDVYLTLDDEPLTGALPMIEPFTYGVGLSPDFPGYIERDPGIWRVRFTADGTHDVIVDTGPIPMAAGQVRSVFLIYSDSAGLGVANVRER